MNRLTRHQLQKSFIGLTVLLVSMLALWLTKGIYQETEVNPINEFRVMIHPIYRELREIPSEDNRANYYTGLIEEFNTYDEALLISIVDLSGQIITTTNDDYSNTSYLFLDELLYMDHHYEASENRLKLSMPLYKDLEVNGFVVFEVATDYLDSISVGNDTDTIKSIQKLVTIAIPILVLLLVVLLWLALYKQKDASLENLKLKMENMSKGVLETIEIPNKSDHKELFIKYNIVVEELSYVMKQQASYENNRKDFLTRISHELKTPIATINAYVEGLMSPVADTDETRERYQKIIAEKMQQLMKQIDELFKYAQEASGRFKYNFEECYADEVFGQLFETLSRSELIKTVVVNQIPKCLVTMDKSRIEQVLMNLINNAMKHSTKSGVVTLRGYRQDREIVIEVEDQGEGIVPKDMPFIFDSYYQGENSEKKDYEGVGLGLSICKDILTKHKGSIKVKSVVGVGTIFTLFIPVT